MDVATDQAALEVLGICREHAEHTRVIVDELHDMIVRQATPARAKSIVLTQAVPRVGDDAKEFSLSIGLYNPTAVPICLALDGGRATKGARATVVPPETFAVFPEAAMFVEIGVDPIDQPALAAGDAVVRLYRFAAVQAAFLGKGV